MGLRQGAALLAAFLLLALAGCSREQAEDKAREILEQAETAAGSIIVEGLDKLKDAEYQGGPFENDMDSAREYLLGQLSEKYGCEFIVVGDEDLVNYGALAGATYTCKAAPAEAPDHEFTALVSQSRYRKVIDDYAVWFYKEEAEAPVTAFCQEKEYILDQRVTLEMPATAATWTGEDSVRFFLNNSGAYVKIVLRLEDGRDAAFYAEQLKDFMSDIAELDCDLLLQARSDKTYIYHRELSILDGFDPAGITLEDIQEDVEIMMMVGPPK